MNHTENNLIGVSVAYADPDKHVWLNVQVAQGVTVRDAIEQSGLLERFPSIDLNTQKVGIFGKLTKLDAPVNEGDRIEVYRPIIADPKKVPRRDKETETEFEESS